VLDGVFVYERQGVRKGSANAIIAAVEGLRYATSCLRTIERGLRCEECDLSSLCFVGKPI
jgi:hypothetical protein